MGLKTDPRNPHEDDDLIVIADFLDAIDVVWTHVPNETKGPVQHHARRARKGVKRGIPDVLIFTPPPSYPAIRGTALELKRKTGGVATADQHEWLHMLAGVGWATHIANGADEGLKWLRSLGYGFVRR